MIKHYVQTAAILITVRLSKSVVFADEGDAALSAVKNATSPVTDKVEKVGKGIEGIYGSLYVLLMRVGILICLIGMILAFLCLGLSSRGYLHEAAKMKLAAIAVAVLLIGGATTFVTIFLQVFP